jgi:hypothetical protein
VTSILSVLPEPLNLMVFPSVVIILEKMIYNLNCYNMV